MSRTTTPDVESRRDRQRRELVDEVKAVARRMLHTGGRDGVSWRGIAREVGLNPASLYTYFAGLDDLFTALLLDSYASLADAVELAANEHADSPPRSRSHALVAAYRSWATTHPSEYNLLFTDQIPGYAAPPDGPTVDAQNRVFAPFIAAIDDELDTGLATTERLDRDQETDLVGLFGLLHGLVSLEVNHHLDWLSSDLGDLIETQFTAMIDGIAARRAG